MDNMDNMGNMGNTVNIINIVNIVNIVNMVWCHIILIYQIQHLIPNQILTKTILLKNLNNLSLNPNNQCSIEISKQFLANISIGK
jgi:hypothetical protein